MLGFAISLVALVGVNLWHAILLITYQGAKRPDSISEHAYQSAILLGRHRVLHILFSVALTTYALVQLLPNREYLLASLLIFGAVMDVVEVLTLRRSDPGHPLRATPHQITAWLMAFAYLAYGVLVAKLAGLPALAYHSVWVLFVVILSIAIFYRFKKFWISQMAYFAYLSVVIAIAHFRVT